MKVINILGSPRKNGSSAKVANVFVEIAQQSGATVDNFYLNGMKYRGCQACEQCHTKRDHCILEDDLEKVLEGICTADIVVFSSPVYWGDTSAQFKNLTDRMWSLLDVDRSKEDPYTSRVAEGKTAVLVLTQEMDETMHGDVVERYSEMLGMFGFNLKVVRATGLSMGEKDHDLSDVQSEARILAEKIFNA